MINLGLSRITALVVHLPTKRTWKAIHIAGTNGKGSVAAYLSSLFLRLSKPKDIHSELKIGRFTSPHLIDRWDCITINDQPVSEALFLHIEKQVKTYIPKAIDDLRRNHQSLQEEDEVVTEFELLTATAFEIFSQHNCQVAIIECGLGGRLDATNVLQPQDVACSVLTKIGLDHMGILGNTVEAITREKAGIAKHNVPMVIDGTNPSIVVEAAITVAKTHNITPLLSQQSTTTTLPPHQQNNLTLALTTFTTSQPHLTRPLHFQNLPPTLLPLIIQDVQTSYPARLQHLALDPLIPSYPHEILLDGAHNPQSAIVLREYIDSLSSQPHTWILGMSRGKDVAEILRILLRPGDGVVCCAFGPVDGMPWVSALEPKGLAEEAARVVGWDRVCVVGDVVEAVERGVEVAGVGRIVVAGSLYLAGDLLRALRDGREVVRRRFDVGEPEVRGGRRC